MNANRLKVRVYFPNNRYSHSKILPYLFVDLIMSITRRENLHSQYRDTVNE